MVNGLSAPEETGNDLGTRLRHARMQRRLSLREVAEGIGCSENLITELEDGNATPSLSLLHRLAGVLGHNIGQFFATVPHPQGVVARAGTRLAVDLDPQLQALGRKGPGIRVERLVPSGPAHLLQGSIHLVEPGASGGTVSHAGEEVGYVIEGELELQVGSERFMIAAGDSFHFRSEIPHGYRNRSDKPARVIFVNTPPSF